MTIMAQRCVVDPTERREDCAADNEYCVQLVRWFLKPIGAWPLRIGTSKAEKAVSDALIVLCISLLAVPAVPCAMWTIFEREEMLLKLKAVGPLSFWLMACMKYCSLIVHGRNIKRCLDHIETDWKGVTSAQDRVIMLNNARIGRYFAGFCVMFVHSGTYFYDIAKYFTTTAVSVGNESVDVHTLPLPFYNGIADTRFSPAYEIVFASQFVSSFVVNSITAGACSLAATFVMHACGQLKVIMSWLENFLDGRMPLKQRQADIVKKHLRVLSFVSLIEEVMNQICLVELVGCTLNICLLGYYFLVELQQNETANTLAYSTVFVSMTFNIFIFCYIGEILSEQCKQVGEIAYMTEWYRLQKNIALGFILIISRSRCVIRITGGKLINLSLVTFASVIKTSVGYLNMLRQVM